MSVHYSTRAATHTHTYSDNFRKLNMSNDNEQFISEH